MVALVQAWRSLRRRPAFTAACVLTLACGIGITAGTFAVVDAVVLKPLPYPAPDRLVTILEASPAARQRVSLAAPARLQDWSRESRTFGAISGSYGESVTDTSGADPERLAARRVLPGFFDVFGERPAAGRTFTPDEERYGGPAAVIISDGFWQRRFGRSAAAVGGRLEIGGRNAVIVGVMPRTFAPPSVDAWLPAQLSPQLMAVREARFVSGIGRMRPGVTIEQARADLAGVQARLGERYPKSDAGWSVNLEDLQSARAGDQRRPLLTILAAVGLLFAIAIGNVAALMLVQLGRRRTEFAVRTALGASDAQVTGAVAREVLILAALASAGGLALAGLLVRVAATILPEMPRLDEAALDWRVAFFAALLTAAAALAAGVIPAWVSARRQRTVPAASSRVAGGGRRVQAALVAAQIAVGTVLAGSAALLVRSYGALVRVDPGFAADGAVTFRVAATWDEDRGRVGALQQQLLEQIAALPGVHAAGLANFLPGTGATLRSQIRVEGIAGAEADGSMTVGTRTVSPGYFAALGIPLVAGRWCETSAFGAPGPREAVVNRQFAAVYGNGAPLTGRRLTFTQDATTWSIVGVAGDVTEDGAGAPVAPYVYVCMPLGSWPDPEYVVRATGDPSLLVPAIRGIVRRLDPGRPVFAISRLADVFAAGLEQPRLNAAALTGFTAAALTLVAVGLYALLMLGVTDRRRELGVRLALGASPARLARGVLGSTLRIVGAGVAAGAVLLACAARLLASLLFGVSPFDPLALGSGAVALAIVAAAAAAGPIRRVLAVDPAVALRD